MISLQFFITSQFANISVKYWRNAGHVHIHGSHWCALLCPLQFEVKCRDKLYGAAQDEAAVRLQAERDCLTDRQGINSGISTEVSVVHAISDTSDDCYHALATVASWFTGWTLSFRRFFKLSPIKGCAFNVVKARRSPLMILAVLYESNDDRQPKINTRCLFAAD